VLTQDHWDSAYAIANMSLAGPPEHNPGVLLNTDDLRIETIVDFADFDVLRVEFLRQGAQLDQVLLQQFAGYAMVAIVSGHIDVASQAGSISLAFGADADEDHAHSCVAGLVPASAVSPRVRCTSSRATALLARPKPHTAGTIAISQSPA